MVKRVRPPFSYSESRKLLRELATTGAKNGIDLICAAALTWENSKWEVTKEGRKLRPTFSRQEIRAHILSDLSAFGYRESSQYRYCKLGQDFETYLWWNYGLDDTADRRAKSHAFWSKVFAGQTAESAIGVLRDFCVSKGIENPQQFAAFLKKRKPENIGETSRRLNAGLRASKSFIAASRKVPGVWLVGALGSVMHGRRDMDFVKLARTLTRTLNFEDLEILARELFVTMRVRRDLHHRVRVLRLPPPQSPPPSDEPSLSP